MEANHSLTITGFNPRPPLLAGDPVLIVLVNAGPAVSIRARHCWRAIQVQHALGDAVVAVSIRARHCWRAIRGAVLGKVTATGVSIRARHCWRAIRHRLRRTL